MGEWQSILEVVYCWIEALLKTIWNRRPWFTNENTVKEKITAASRCFGRRSSLRLEQRVLFFYRLHSYPDFFWRHKGRCTAKEGGGGGGLISRKHGKAKQRKIHHWEGRIVWLTGHQCGRITGQNAEKVSLPKCTILCTSERTILCTSERTWRIPVCRYT